MMNSDDKENSSIGRDGLGEGISERPRRRRRSQAVPEDSGTAFPEAPAAEGTPEPVNEAVKEEPAGHIPPYLQDAHYKGAKNLGRGLDYKYPHNYPNHYVEQQYLPDNMVGRKFYELSDSGYEKTLKGMFKRIGKE